MNTLSYIITKWIHFYNEFAPDFINRIDHHITDVIIRINHGDCGTTALAVSHCFETSFPEAPPVELIDIIDHAYIKHDGYFYDAFSPSGEANESIITSSYPRSQPAEKVSTEELAKRYLGDCDWIGAKMISTFCSIMGVPDPEYLSRFNLELVPVGCTEWANALDKKIKVKYGNNDITTDGV